jgi:hypothetical protein
MRDMLISIRQALVEDGFDFHESSPERFKHRITVPPNHTFPWKLVAHAMASIIPRLPIALQLLNQLVMTMQAPTPVPMFDELR